MPLFILFICAYVNKYGLKVIINIHTKIYAYEFRSFRAIKVKVNSRYLTDLYQHHNINIVLFTQTMLCLHMYMYACICVCLLIHIRLRISLTVVAVNNLNIAHSRVAEQSHCRLYWCLFVS